MQASKRPMPVGIEDFKDLVTGNYYFIDKTRFIKELIDTQGKVTLITRPRRFGKTLSLSMLQYFFTLKNAEENRQLFAGLDIERAGEKYMSQQGTRPVVFMTLKEIRRPNYTSMLAMLASLLQDIYGCYRCILDSNRLEDSETEYFLRILAGKGSEEDLAVSLKRLMVYMEKCYGTTPILLLDEYDAPILSAWENGYYRECIDFMRGFLGSALKTNPALGFAVLTGITRISKESIFSGLNNLDVCGVLTELYNDAMGFTQEESAKLMADCGQEDKLPELAKWYDGYRFGQAEIYNPWSVINFVQHGCKFQRYWINVSGNSILQVLLKNVDDTRYEELQSLLRFREAYVDTMMDEGIIYPDIETDDNALYMMLLTTGYLKAIKTWQDRRGRWWCRLQIPNREVLLAYEDEVLAKVAGPSNRVPLFAQRYGELPRHRSAGVLLPRPDAGPHSPHGGRIPGGVQPRKRLWPLRPGLLTPAPRHPRRHSGAESRRLRSGAGGKGNRSPAADCREGILCRAIPSRCKRYLALRHCLPRQESLSEERTRLKCLCNTKAKDNIKKQQRRWQECRH